MQAESNFNTMERKSVKIWKYLVIHHSDETGTVGEVYMEEAQRVKKISVGQPLLVATVEPRPQEVQLGVVLQIKEATNGFCVQTEQGWWHISRNENLEILLGGPLEWGFAE